MSEARTTIRPSRAAAILGVQRWRVTHWAKIGMIPASAWFWRRGGRIYYEDVIQKMKDDVDQSVREYEARTHSHSTGCLVCKRQ